MNIGDRAFCFLIVYFAMVVLIAIEVSGCF